MPVSYTHLDVYKRQARGYADFNLIVSEGDISLNWAGAAYIDKDGIFTGKLSADTVKTLHLDATQITSRCV